MDFSLTEEQTIIVDMVRRFVRDEILPLELSLDPDADEVSPEILTQLTEKTKAMGLYGLDTPPEYGGPDIDMVTRVLIAIECSQHRAGIYVPCYGAFGGARQAQLFEATEVQKEKKKSASVKLYNKSFRQKIRTFRIAIATTAEYTNYWGDNNQSNGSNKEDALAAIASTLNRINSIFERDLNIRLELVSDDSLIYEDTDQDPFTGNFSSELQRTLDDVLGDENYDIGHLFDYGEPNGDAGCIAVSYTHLTLPTSDLV